MAHGWLRYGVASVSLGCMALVITRAASLGCASNDVGALPEAPPSANVQASAPDSGALAPAAVEPSAAGAASPAPSDSAGSASATQPLEAPGNKGEWGGMSKSGRMITPQPQGAPNPPPQSQGK